MTRIHTTHGHAHSHHYSAVCVRVGPLQVSVTVGGKTHSTHDGTLVAVGKAVEGKGIDSLGSYTSVTQNYTASGTPFVTSHRLYGNKFAIFEQVFPEGATGTAVTKVSERTDPHVLTSPRPCASCFVFLPSSHIPYSSCHCFMSQGDVSSCFPAIDPTSPGGASLGYVSWAGRFLEASRGGVWQGGKGTGSPGVGTGGSGGPFVVFGEDMTDSLVFSTASNFMTNTLGMSPAPGDGSFCAGGLDAPVASVPAGYSLETIVLLGTGVNSAIMSYGAILLSKYKTTRPVDYSNQWLGFSTDNGA